MRERTTWQSNGRETPRQAATHRRAEDESTMDIYSMHTKRVQPKHDAYKNAESPADWAESVAPDKVESEEYEKGTTKRNEIGLPEFRKDTFKDQSFQKPSYANRTSSERKAIASHRLASTLLRTEDRDLVRKVAVGFMGLSEQALNNAVKAVDQVRPEALDDQSRFRRALACTKLAASMLGKSAKESTVERLARVIYRVDDPTLKAMVKTVAAANADGSKAASSAAASSAAASSAAASSAAGSSSAASSAAATPAGKEDGSGAAKGPAAHKATAKKTEKTPAGTASAHASSGAKWGSSAAADDEDSAPAKVVAGKGEGMPKDVLEGFKAKKGSSTAAEACSPAGMSASAMVADMLGGSAGGEGGSAGGEGGSDGAVAPEASPMAQGTQFKAPKPITFGDEDSAAALTPAPVPAPTAAAKHTQVAALEALFADDPEVRAQRELSTAHREAAARASGYANVSRTASTKGAKKLGNVQASKGSSQELNLEMLWERP